MERLQSVGNLFMHIEMKHYIVKEYGLWSVLIVSALVGVGVSRAFSWGIIPLLLALGLLANSKQAYSLWAAKTGDKQAFGIFFAQVFIATGIVVALFRDDVLFLLPFLIFPAAYLLVKKLFGEHFILTELLGVVILSLAAVIAKFQLFGGIDVRLFVGVAFYFMASVFKVKALLSNKTKDRVVSVLYLGIAVFAYQRMHISLIVLLPLLDNLVAAIVPYKVKLQTTGWIEVAKSVVFLGLMIGFY